MTGIANPNCAATRIRPVHVLPPRRYAGEDGDPEPGRPSVEALACRQMLREYRRVRGRIKSLRWHGGPPSGLPGDDEGTTGPAEGPPPGKHEGASSRFRGVSWQARDRRWRAQVTHEGVTYQAGSSSDEATAARLHDRLALEIKGRDAKLNFPGPARPLPDLSGVPEEPEDGLDQFGRPLDGRGRRMAQRRSRYRGVYWDRETRAWRARVYVDGRYYSAGQSPDEESAARMRDELALRLLGRGAVLNFPRETATARGGAP